MWFREVSDRQAVAAVLGYSSSLCSIYSAGFHHGTINHHHLLQNELNKTITFQLFII